jgi:hypothetical protein
MSPSYDVTDVIHHPMMEPEVRVFERSIEGKRWRVRQREVSSYVVQEEWTRLPDVQED